MLLCVCAASLLTQYISTLPNRASTKLFPSSSKPGPPLPPPVETNASSGAEHIGLAQALVHVSQREVR